MKYKKIAIVCDDLIQSGGQERLVIELFNIFPNATLYTPVVSAGWLARCQKLGITIRTSFMQWLPFKTSLNKIYSLFLLHILALESFDFSTYDLVLSVSSRYAHGIVTKPQTFHISYINSPGRMFWESYKYFNSNFIKALLGPLLSHVRIWDYSVSHRADLVLANSKVPQARIKKYYGVDSQIVYPFSNLSIDSCVVADIPSKYFILISRLVPWKRFDIVVGACQRLSINLLVVGDGPDMSRLKALSKNNSCIQFMGYVSDPQKTYLLQHCEALIHPQEEDFGIAAVEAMSVGKPVIAYGKGGALETVVYGVTGEFFGEQSVDSISNILKNFDASKYASENCIRQAQKFSREAFRKSLLKLV